MGKITEDAIRAFRNRDKFKRGNTEVYTWPSGSAFLLLHGNTIATLDGDGLFISNGGFEPEGSRYRKDTPTGSKTTKERLNGLPNVHIVQKNFQWFLNGELWDGSLIKVE
tara:strand:- start:2164 stop:2493 length:330 start_codon:yes stop_codon:yes gene_type:complete